VQEGNVVITVERDGEEDPPFVLDALDASGGVTFAVSVKTGALHPARCMLRVHMAVVGKTGFAVLAPL
jgi:hypothetical protein